MSISKFIRRAFGAEDDAVAEEFDDLDVSTPSSEKHHITPLTTGPNDVSADLTDAMLSIINSQLPEGLEKCIDIEAQRRWLAGKMGAALQAYDEKVRAERNELSGKREEQKAALLSEQRQRRALADRNRDLENKIDELASEIEQHKLTISSLMNKLRVAEVSEQDESTSAQEILQLTKDLEAAKEVIARADAILADKDKEIAALSEQIAELQSAAALQTALDARQQAVGETEEPAAAPTPRKRRGRPRRQPVTPPDTANDSSADLEEIDWLLPGGVPAGHVPHVSDPEFGYQPPKQTPAPDSDAQLTLF